LNNSSSSQTESERDRLKRALIAIQRLQGRVDALEGANSAEIAIIGMACRFPGGVDSPASLWELLLSGRDPLVEVPASRWPVDDYYDPDPEAVGKIVVREGGFVDQVEWFDAPFFSVSPREARSLDPQQRLLLECVWEAIERSNRPAAALSGSRTAVYLGISNSEYLDRLRALGEESIDAFMGSGNAHSVAAGRIAYHFGLQGPAVAIDTACSSSLVALHHACQAIRHEGCDYALAAGVNLLLSPILSINHSRARMLAPDGRCKSFDAAADGFGRSEGCGVLLLRPLAAAREDNDPILAVIRGSATSQDGRTSGITVPSGPSQQAVIRRALDNARLTPQQIDAVEAHGTGTALGDPIEIHALGELFGQADDRAQPLRVGSIKSVIGHCEAAAGIAGVIKATMALRSACWPGTLHLQQPSPKIDWQRYPVRVTAASEPWPDSSQPRRIGVSSFGFGGTNAHVVIEQGESGLPLPTLAGGVEQPELLLLSARSPEALLARSTQLADWLATEVDRPLSAVATLLAHGRDTMQWRTACSGEREAVIEQLRAIDCPPGPIETPPGIALLFTGQGSQYAGMGRRLMAEEPRFRAEVERAIAALAGVVELDPATLFDDQALLDRVDHAQLALFILEYALARLLLDSGVRPQWVMGHSLGELVAATIAGRIALGDALRLVARRGELMAGLPGTGGMLAILAGRERIDPLIAAAALPALEYAAENGREHWVASGRPEELEAAAAILTAAGIESRRLPVAHAFHSSLMEPLLDRFQQAADAIDYQPGNGITLIGNVDGEAVEQLDGRYWRRHLRGTVRFGRGIERLLATGVEVVVEIGPKPVLSGMARRDWPQAAVEWLPTLRGVEDGRGALLETLARLYRSGVELDRERLFDRSSDSGWRHLQLPLYPFQRQRHWVEPPAAPGSIRPEGDGDRALRFASLEWQRLSMPEQGGAAANGRWLLIAGRGSLADRLAQSLRARGAELVSIVPSPAGNYAREQIGQLAAGAPFNHTVWLADPCDQEGLSIDGWPDREAAVALLNCCNRLLQQLPHLGGRLSVVTSAAVSGEAGLPPVTGDQPPPNGATLWGMARSMRLEWPAWGGIIDLPLATTPALIEALIDAIATAGDEDQRCWRNGSWWVPRVVPTKPPSAEQWRPRSDGAYWITGGNGALGQQLAKRLIDSGARRLYLSGRSRLSSELAALIGRWQGGGVAVDYQQVDVCDPGQIADQLTRIARERPLTGIFHCAGLPGYQPLVGMEEQVMREVLAPKVVGGWHLHRLTRDLPLEQFVCFSSIAAAWGSVGQTHYAAANQFLDALVCWRSTLGLPGLAVDWGPWAGGGMADEEGLAALERVGISPLPASEALTALFELLATGERRAVVAAVDWQRLHDTYASRGREQPFASPVAELEVELAEDRPAPAGLMELLAPLDEEQRCRSIEQALGAEVAAVLGLSRPPDAGSGFSELGIDSILALEIRDRTTRLTGVELPATLAFDYPNIRTLARHLLDRLTPELPDTRPATGNEERSGEGEQAGPDDDPLARELAALERLL
jgi:acyl transferase domain-containing protein/acyl carrier protein